MRFSAMGKPFMFIHTVNMYYMGHVISVQFIHQLMQNTDSWLNGTNQRLMFKFVGRRVSINPRHSKSKYRRIMTGQHNLRICMKHRRNLLFVQRPNYLTNGLMPQSYVKDEEPAITTATNLSISPSCTNGVGIHADNKQQTTNNRQIFNANLTTSSSAEETNSWLINNRFNTYVNTFGNFSGADILRLSRDDLIQICGLADGIRLYNALHAKTIAPKLILYVCTDRSNVFHAIYLTSYTNSELGEKLSSLIQASTDQIQGYFVQGPNGIHIHINDEVIRHFKNEAMYTVEIIANMNMNTCRILLKPLNP